MPSLRQLLSHSTGLKITYLGFALYALHLQATYFLPPPDAPSVMNVLLVALNLAGSVGGTAAVLSMIVTGVRGARRNGWRSWWTFWAVFGLSPFVVVAIAMVSLSATVQEGTKTLVELNKDDMKRVELLRQKVAELKSQKAKPELISMASRLYASGLYLHKGEIVDYVDEAGNPVKYKPAESEVQYRNDMKGFPGDLEKAQQERALEIAYTVALPLLTVLAAFITPLGRIRDPTK